MQISTAGLRLQVGRVDCFADLLIPFVYVQDLIPFHPKHNPLNERKPKKKKEGIVEQFQIWFDFDLVGDQQPNSSMSSKAEKLKQLLKKKLELKKQGKAVQEEDENEESEDDQHHEESEERNDEEADIDNHDEKDEGSGVHEELKVREVQPPETVKGKL